MPESDRTWNVEPISDILPKLRHGRGLSQYGLAARLTAASGNCSLTRDEVARWERGKRIPGPYWRRWLSRVLEVPAHELERAAAFTRRVRREQAARPAADHRHRVWPPSRERNDNQH
ncbi:MULTISPECIES: helix-turn-helix domain-containing protein [unclassified Saccharothrix]|uniref:helix-turn-helix domain-containing protein n=1 Tax=unclassified Saccharothrix TaxID=2593673 RepID=UPI00307D87BA